MAKSQWEKIYKRLFVVRFVLLVVILGLSLVVAYIFWHQGPADRNLLVAQQISSGSTGGCPIGSCGLSQAKKTYTNSDYGFSLRYPSMASLTTDGRDLAASDLLAKTGKSLVTITLLQDEYTGTNLAEASVVVLASNSTSTVPSCSNPVSGHTSSTTTINGLSFLTYSFTDAGAGNYYNSTIHRIVHNGQCYDIVTLIHSTNIANYPADQHIQKFDQKAVEANLNSILTSFAFTK